MSLWNGRRKRQLLSTFLLVFIICYIALTVLVLNGGNQEEYREMKTRLETPHKTQYNLPSLDEILNSTMDLDFRKVVSNYREELDEIPELTPKVNLVIVSTWRSGSTLLGEVVASYPGVFYHYEPLMPYGMDRITTDKDITEASKLVSDLLQCSYKDLDSYIRFAFSNPDIFRRNERLWKICSGMPRAKCYIWDNLDKLCSLFPVHIMKIVRARLSLVSSLLDVPNTKIIWLVRDPRATISSRLHNVDWCNTEICNDPSVLCQDLYQDYETYLHLKQKQPEQIMVLRYEDLAQNPTEKSKEVFKFIGLEYHPKVEEYLKTHLNEDVESPWSTIHVSQKRMDRWMKVSPWEEVVKTQYSCRHQLDLLGYRTFDSESDYNAGGNPVKKNSVDKL